MGLHGVCKNKLHRLDKIIDVFCSKENGEIEIIVYGICECGSQKICTFRKDNGDVIEFNSIAQFVREISKYYKVVLYEESPIDIYGMGKYLAVAVSYKHRSTRPFLLLGYKVT